MVGCVCAVRAFVFESMIDGRMHAERRKLTNQRTSTSDKTTEREGDGGGRNDGESWEMTDDGASYTPSRIFPLPFTCLLSSTRCSYVRVGLVDDWVIWVMIVDWNCLIDVDDHQVVSVMGEHVGPCCHLHLHHHRHQPDTWAS